MVFEVYDQYLTSDKITLVQTSPADEIKSLRLEQKNEEWRKVGKCGLLSLIYVFQLDAPDWGD